MNKTWYIIHAASIALPELLLCLTLDPSKTYCTPVRQKAAVDYDTSIESAPFAMAKDTAPPSPMRRFSESETNYVM
jgi:hypothetical protein